MTINVDTTDSAAAPREPAAPVAGHREELCPHCGNVNPAGRELCLDCGQKLPLESVKTLINGKEREELKQEAIKFGLTLLAVTVLVGVSSFIPLTARLLLIVGAIAFMVWRFLAKIMG